ncbi:hypothetical protein HEP84_06275 [Streptomyces sp. RLB1-33]|uniref:hypothetical protein n=1 Tax=Streptomyces mirabilis TaxID=68239 RepID=UPI00143EB15E|nr:MULTISPECIES: hypothetical protein [Streptomyces]QIY68870.1 hypothetical protein HEP84_06275 [Streptomyces sp. RLB1-33]QUW84346.1 hypothetical protein SMIR_38720 [Streptomyces mirabilis]
MTDVLEWDARTLLEEYDGGGPSTGERLLAEGLARARWSGSAFRASLRDVPESVRAGRGSTSSIRRRRSWSPPISPGYGRRYTGFFVTTWIAAGGGSS